MTKILISDSMNEIAQEILKNNNIEVDVITDLIQDELIKIANQYDGIIVRSATKITKEIIESTNKLKIIGRAGAGVDNIDLVSAKEKKIIVMNTPGGNTNATAEHTVSLLLSLYRNISKANIGTHKGLWEKNKFKGIEIKGKKIGLIGFGNVSKRVAEILKSFDVELFVYSKHFSKQNDKYSYINQLSFEEILTSCDIISFHCKFNKDDNPLVTLKELKKMKPNSVIINTARGGIIDENDLKYALENSIIYGAAIDVYSKEPATKNILFGTKNLILTPHIAASTKEAQIVVAKQISEQISEYFNSGKIQNSVINF